MPTLYTIHVSSFTISRFSYSLYNIISTNVMLMNIFLHIFLLFIAIHSITSSYNFYWMKKKLFFSSFTTTRQFANENLFLIYIYTNKQIKNLPTNHHERSSSDNKRLQGVQIILMEHKTTQEVLFDVFLSHLNFFCTHTHIYKYFQSRKRF